jgi:hypothetical protein
VERNACTACAGEDKSDADAGLREMFERRAHRIHVRSQLCYLTHRCHHRQFQIADVLKARFEQQGWIE